MSADGSQAWGVGIRGSLARYTRESGWKEDHNPGLEKAANLLAIWVSEDGKKGWIVGENGTILKMDMEARH